MGRRPRTPEAQLHNRLAVLRAERGLTRQDLAEALEVNPQTVGYLERGDYSPSLELAFRLGEFFELPIEAIFARVAFAPLSGAGSTDSASVPNLSGANSTDSASVPNLSQQLTAGNGSREDA